MCLGLGWGGGGGGDAFFTLNTYYGNDCYFAETRKERLKIHLKLFIATFFTTAKYFTTSIIFAQMYQFSLNLNLLQQKFCLT